MAEVETRWLWLQRLLRMVRVSWLHGPADRGDGGRECTVELSRLLNLGRPLLVLRLWLRRRLRLNLRLLLWR